MATAQASSTDSPAPLAVTSVDGLEVLIDSSGKVSGVTRPLNPILRVTRSDLETCSTLDSDGIYYITSQLHMRPLTFEESDVLAIARFVFPDRDWGLGTPDHCRLETAAALLRMVFVSRDYIDHLAARNPDLLDEVTSPGAWHYERLRAAYTDLENKEGLSEAQVNLAVTLLRNDLPVRDVLSAVRIVVS